ncbi:hypothetical protein IFM89_024167 [Coptis chinensis]|uniref:DYW domain-containing protein n=1 Tax=Coptis chinensis TaxID=261450 RepID=A0A835H615_9MAGN|nr:hypothetical protein IFM89_024167 [Coptis chinensis]
MKNSGVEFDEFTIVAMLSACSLLSDYKAGKQIHLLICKNFKSGDCNVFLKSALLDMYAKCGLMEMVRRVFGSLGSKKSTTAWSSMVLGYARRGEIEIACRYFDQILEKDLVSWTIMINGYAQMGRHTEALELFVQMEDMGLKPDETILVAALSACARLGALVKVKPSILEKSKTVSVYNALIYGLAQHGLGEDVLRAFKDRESADLTLDEITFIGVLCACSHGGLVEEGKRIFDSMLDVHRIRPQVGHYCCMVDLLGRSGHVKEAYDFIMEIPFNPNSVIWRSLLGSCKIHGNIEVGVIAAEILLKVDPDHGARYVVLSNMLTDANRWKDAGGVGVKPRGWSCIEANGTLHRFQASDKSHPQTKEIDIMLEDIAARLKSAGYVRDTTHVSFDIEEEEKGTVVTYHSEKLALAFALINLDPEATIPIVKNLCGDCHSVFKLCSKIYRRDSVVRDLIRFHHFKSGVCSCKYFW